jgi:hypothetical protein
VGCDVAKDEQAEPFSHFIPLLLLLLLLPVRMLADCRQADGSLSYRCPTNTVASLHSVLCSRPARCSET